LVISTSEEQPTHVWFTLLFAKKKALTLFSVPAFPSESCEKDVFWCEMKSGEMAHGCRFEADPAGVVKRSPG
jgi:hypothetical protein